MINLTNIKVNTPKANIEEYVTVLYGKPKAGKTSLFAKLLEVVYGDLDSGLLIATEKGYKALKVKAQDIDKLEDFQETVKQLIKNKNSLPFKLICVDTIDELHKYAIKHVLKRESIKDGKKYIALNDIPWGKGHEMVENEIIEPLKDLKNAGYGLMLITHDKDKKFESRDGLSYDKTTCSLPDRVRNPILNMADFINYIDIAKEKDAVTGKVTDKRYIYFRASGSDLEAGSRFADVPEKIPYDVGLYYETFQKAVLSSLGDLATEKNIEEIKKEQMIQSEKESQIYLESKELDKDTLLAELKEAHGKATDSAKEAMAKYMMDNKIQMDTFAPLQIKEVIEILKK